MPRYSASTRSAGAGSATLPLMSLYATAGVRPGIVEVGIFNTTATAVVVALVRLTTAGTTGTAIAVDGDDMPEQAANALPYNTHTVGPSLGKEHRRASLGAAIGSGVIWTWDPAAALAIPAVSTDGVGILVPTGTGQVVDAYFCWIE